MLTKLLSMLVFGVALIVINVSSYYSYVNVNAAKNNTVEAVKTYYNGAYKSLWAPAALNTIAIGLLVLSYFTTK